MYCALIEWDLYETKKIHFYNQYFDELLQSMKNIFCQLKVDYFWINKMNFYYQYFL